MNTDELEQLNEDLNCNYANDMFIRSAKLSEIKMIDRALKIILFIGWTLFVAGVIILALERIIR